MAPFTVISEYIISNPIGLQFVGLCILWNDNGGLSHFCSTTSGFMSPLKRKNLLIFIFECEYFHDGVFVFYSEYGWFSVQNGGFWHAVWVFGCYLSRLSFYHLLVELSRQDCRRTWALLECLELWTKLVEPQGFVICDLLLGTTSDATPHDTMIFEWCTHTCSTECLCSLWNETGGFYPFCPKTFISLGVVVFFLSMVDFRTEWRTLTRSLSYWMSSLSFTLLLSVGFIIETRL